MRMVEIRVCLVAFAVAGFTGPAVAQPDRVELWGGISTALTAPTGELVSSYSPPLQFAIESHGGQTLTLDAGHGVGFEAGVNLFAAPHFGIQILANRTSMDLAGANGPYALHLTYVTAQPPFLVPQTFNLDESIPWPDTSGSLTQLTIAVNPVVRLGRADGVNATVSGGLSYYRLSGTAQTLGYTAFVLGGHSVLFSNEYHLAVSLEPSNVVGFNAGGEINIPLGRHAAILVGYRYLGGPETDVPVRLTTIVNADQVIIQETPTSIAEHFRPGPARLGVSGSRLLFGVKVRP